MGHNLYGYLGHFATRPVLREGHNVSGQKLHSTDIEPENVEPGSRKGRIRIKDPGAGHDRMIIDPLEPKGYYDQQLWKETDFASGNQEI